MGCARPWPPPTEGVSHVRRATLRSTHRYMLAHSVIREVRLGTTGSVWSHHLRRTRASTHKHNSDCHHDLETTRNAPADILWGAFRDVCGGDGRNCTDTETCDDAPRVDIRQPTTIPSNSLQNRPKTEEEGEGKQCVTSSQRSCFGSAMDAGEATVVPVMGMEPRLPKNAPAGRRSVPRHC